MGIEDIFNGSLEAEPEAIAPAIEQPPVEPVETLEPVADEPPPVPEQPQAEPQPQEEQRHVPLATFLDQRDELKRWKQEAESLRQAQRAPQPQEQAPDPLDDPQGFAAHQERVFEQKLTEQRFQTSDVIARQQHGSEVVDAAGQWAADKARSDPSFAVAYMREPHPVDWIVQQHRKDKLLSDIGGNVDDWFTREAAKRGYVAAPSPIPIAAPAAPQQQVTPATPPRSLASAPGSGGAKDVPTGPMGALGSVFTR
jgi:hypothetical protein